MSSQVSGTAQLSIHSSNRRAGRLDAKQPRTLKSKSSLPSLQHLARKESIHAQSFIQKKHQKSQRAWKDGFGKVSAIRRLDDSKQRQQRFEVLPAGIPTYAIEGYDGDFEVLKYILPREGILDKLKGEQARLKIVLTASGQGFLEGATKTRKSATFGYIGANARDITGFVPAARRNKLLRDYNMCTMHCLKALYRWKLRMCQPSASFKWHTFNYILKIPTDLYFMESDVDLKTCLGIKQGLHGRALLYPESADFQPAEPTLQQLCKDSEREDFDFCQELVDKEVANCGPLQRNRHGQLMRIPKSTMMSKTALLPEISASKRSSKSKNRRRGGGKKKRRAISTTMSMPSLMTR